MQALEFIIVIAALLIIIRAIIAPVRQAPEKFLELIINQIKIKAMSVNAKPNQFVKGMLAPKDRHGNAAPVQPGSVSIHSDNDDVCSVKRDLDDPENELKFQIDFKEVGFANINVSADADTGEGVQTISDSLQVVVEPEQAVGFGIQLGDIQDNPPAAPEENNS
jgi:hypothetical protein